MPKRFEYSEGPEVAEKFEEAMKIILRTPKPERKLKKREPKAEGSSKAKKQNED
jgi:hypothetical protein